MAFTDEKREMLATQPVGRLLMQFALPSIISMCVTSIYNLCDTIFIGHSEFGAYAIAGLAVAFPLMNISTAFRLLSSVGGAAQTSLHMGRNDQQGANLIHGNVIVLSFIVGLLFMLGGLIFLDPILDIFGASGNTHQFARDYMLIYLHGVPIGHLFFTLAAQMRAIGNPKWSMRILVETVALNIILDAVFILGLDGGVKGAALATVLSQFFGLLQCTYIFRKSPNYISLTWNTLRLRLPIVKRIFSIGVSPFSIQLSGCVIVVVINNTLMHADGSNGDLCVGAYGIMYRISQMMILIVSGIAQGMQPIVGVNMGAGLYTRVIKTVTRSLSVVTAVMVIGYGLIFFWAETLAGFLTDNNTLIGYCGPAMRIALCVYPLVGCQMIATTYFNSVGHAKLSMITSLSRMWLFLLPLLLILPNTMGLHGVWWSMSIADCASVILAMVLLWREFRQLPI